MKTTNEFQRQSRAGKQSNSKLSRAFVSQVMLEQMQGLMHLELSGCNDFTEAGLWSSLNARLTSLSVSDCINVADDAIAAISQLLPNLSELSLQAYHVTDTAMAYFTAKQVGLKNGGEKAYDNMQ